MVTETFAFDCFVLGMLVGAMAAFLIFIMWMRE